MTSPKKNQSNLVKITDAFGIVLDYLDLLKKDPEGAVINFLTEKNLSFQVSHIIYDSFITIILSYFVKGFQTPLF